MTHDISTTKHPWIVSIYCPNGQRRDVERFIQRQDAHAYKTSLARLTNLPVVVSFEVDAL